MLFTFLWSTCQVLMLDGLDRGKPKSMRASKLSHNLMIRVMYPSSYVMVEQPTITYDIEEAYVSFQLGYG